MTNETLVTMWLVIKTNQRNAGTKYLDATGKTRSKWRNAHKFLDRVAANAHAAKFGGHVREYRRYDPNTDSIWD